MAPLEPNATARTNNQPLAFFGAQVLLITGLTTHVLLTIRRAARTLAPPSSTRAQKPLRRRHAAIFAILGLLSFAAVTTFSVSWRTLSYFDWAEKGNHETPGSLWSGWYGTGDAGVGYWRLGDWVQDVDLVREWNEVALMQPEGFAWVNQHFIGLSAAAMFFGIEGYRRNLPAKTISAFVLLSQFGSLGFAINLFLVTILYTPVPFYRATPPRRDTLFTPKPAAYLLPIISSFLVVQYMPTLFASNADVTYSTFLRLGYLFVPLYLAFATQLIPASWGHHHPSKAAAHRSFINTFYVLGLASFVLHWKQLGSMFWSNTPPEQDSVYDRLKVAVGKDENNRFLVGLGNTAQRLKLVSKHPAVSISSSDVFFTMISLCTWAFIRKLNVDDMLDCSFLSRFSGTSKTEKHVAFEDQVKTPSPPPTMASPQKKRGRPKKGETTATPSKPATTSSGTLRRSSRRKPSVSIDSDREDSFEPSIQAAEDVARTEADGIVTKEDVVHGGEAAALALFFSYLGGLGQLAAGVLGAEVTSAANE